jgi:tetratricopeptide (TPR) repeat protein
MTALLTLVIGASGHRCIGTSELRPRFSITQLPNYAITRFLQSHSVDPLQQAETLLQNQHYDAAESQLQALTKTQSANPQVWFDLGFAESHLEKNAEAITAYKKAVELSPKWFEANLNLGLALAKAGKLTEAATSFRAATELKPGAGGQQDVGNAWFSLAETLEKSAPGESLAAYKKATELNPANAEARVGAGRILEAQGDAAGAEKEYLAAAKMGNPGALERLIGFYLAQKRLADAESWLQKYLSANPGDLAAQLQLARVLALEGKTQDAIAALEIVNKASPNPIISRELASLYMDAKQYPAAATLLEDLVQKNPSDGRLHCNLGSALLHQHKYPEAEAEFLQGLKLDPGQDDSYAELAYAAQQNRHYEEAIHALDVRGQRLPETASTYWIRAVSYDSLGVFKPAAQFYRLFLAVDGGKSSEQEFKARHRLKAIEH